jgi:hypothetical protein
MRLPHPRNPPGTQAIRGERVLRQEGVNLGYNIKSGPATRQRPGPWPKEP